MQDKQEPDYAKPTIAIKMKDKELVRIQDEKRQTEKAKTIITEHNDILRNERMNPERFIRTKRGFSQVKHTEVATAKVLSQSKKKNLQSKNDSYSGE